MAFAKRAAALAAMALVADGSAFAVHPRGMIELWSSPAAPAWYRRTMRFFGAHPGLCRTLAAAELAVGVALLALLAQRAAVDSRQSGPRLAE